MRQWLEPKVSQLAPGSMSEFALNLKPVRSSGKTVAWMVAL